MLLASSRPASGPLALATAKTAAGHTEPAAGALGLVQLALELGQCFRAPLLHLARPSAHVASMLLAGSAGSRAISIARQGAFLESGGVGGVSGFAFQGTNAHAIVRVAGRPSVAGRRQVRVLRAQRQWVASVAPHSLVCRSLGLDSSGGLAIMEVDLGSCSGLHAHFWDHAVSGRALFPAAGFLELACGAGRSLVGDLAAASLTGVSIPSPCLLSAPGAHVTVLRAEVALSSEGLGRFHISGGRATHVSGSIATVDDDVGDKGDGAESAINASPQCCVGAVELAPPLWWESGCWSPPAALDGAMQLGGASMAVGAAQARTTRVPSAAGAFFSTSPLKGAMAHAIARVGASAGGDSGASSFSSHRLVAGTHSPASGLCDLEARALRQQAASAAAHGASSALASESDSCLYELEWQVRRATRGHCSAGETFFA